MEKGIIRPTERLRVNGENSQDSRSHRQETIPVRERLIVELDRLKHGASENEKLIGMTSEEFRIACSGNAPDVLARAKQVLALAVQTGLEEPWPITEALQSRLPSWFINACKPDQTLDELNAAYEYRKTLSSEEREAYYAAADKSWSAGAWVAAMNPDYDIDLGPDERDEFEDQRQWHWLDAEVVDENTIVASIDMMDWEVLSGDFRWLFIAAGTVEVDGSTHQ